MPLSQLDLQSPLAAAALLAVLFWIEGLLPLFAGRERRMAHGLRNGLLGLLNAAVRGALGPLVFLWAADLAWQERLGLLHRVELPAWAALAVALLTLDLWHYLMHVLCHHIPFLWRFHIVHHHDPHVDSTTALRFHVGEILFSIVAYAAIIFLAGLSVRHILLYEMVLLPVSLFHHANLRLPEGLDRALRLLITTPRMHMVHHSRWQPETDSNFAAVLSVWDRVFGTFRLRRDAVSIDLGLDGYDERDWGSLKGLMLTPLGPIRSGPGTPPPVGDAGSAPRVRVAGTVATSPDLGRTLPLAIAVAAERRPRPRTLRPCQKSTDPEAPKEPQHR